MLTAAGAAMIRRVIVVLGGETKVVRGEVMAASATSKVGRVALVTERRQLVVVRQTTLVKQLKKSSPSHCWMTKQQQVLPQRLPEE